MAKDTAKTKKEKKHFLKDFRAELKKVIWPTPKQIVNNTVAVITIVLITAVVVLVLDLTFEAINKYGVDKLKNIISTRETENVIENNNDEADGETIDSNSVTENNDENVDANLTVDNTSEV